MRGVHIRQKGKMTLVLMDVTENALDLLYRAYRQCYYGGFVPVMDEVSDEKKKEFIGRMIEIGHWSPLEHVKFTFAVDGISRACSHQLVRHRIASYSQQSQRYVDMENFDYVIPPSVEKIPEAREEFERVIGEIKKGYRRLKEIFERRGVTGEEANEDIR